MVMAMVKREKGWVGFKRGSHRSQWDRENPLGNLTDWKERSDRLRPESWGSSMLIFELANRQRRCYFFSSIFLNSHLTLEKIDHYGPVWKFCLIIRLYLSWYCFQVKMLNEIIHQKKSTRFWYLSNEQ